MLHRPPSHLCCWFQRKAQAAWASETGWSCVSCETCAMGHRGWGSCSTKPRKGTSAQKHEKSKFSSRKLSACFEQQKSVHICCCAETFMFKASSSKSNSSTSWGTLHFTRQPRSCEVAPDLKQFGFAFRPYTSDTWSSLFHVRCSSNDCSPNEATWMVSVSDWW